MRAMTEPYEYPHPTRSDVAGEETVSVCKALRIMFACLLAASVASPAFAQFMTIQPGATPPSDAVALAKRSIERALEALPKNIAETMRRSGVPGLAVAIVHDSRTVFAKGYGVRELGKILAVDSRTVFQIASISKPVSATIAAIEVTNGGVSWNDPVVKYLPSFKLGNAYVTEHATIGDFFAHRTGLPGTAGDELEDLGFNRNDILDRLGQLPLDTFRNSFHYANFSTTVGAEAVAAAANEKWEEMAEKRLFRPLSMTSTSYRYSDFVARENRAVLHAYENGRFRPLYIRQPDQQSPAGGVSSNVLDLAEWLKLLLSNGQHKGDQLIAPQALLPALSPQSFNAPGSELSARTGFYGYGFNVNVEAGGRTSMGHSGAFLLGAGTAFKIIPSANVGIVVLTNGAPVGAAEAVVAQFIDTALYGSPSRDWFSAYNALTKAYFAPQGDLTNKTKPESIAPSRDLNAYIGRFENSYFGAAEVKIEDGGLKLIVGPGRVTFPLQHWDGDVFALAPAGEAAPPGSLSSVHFSVQSGRAIGFEAAFFDAHGLGRWSQP